MLEKLQESVEDVYTMVDRLRDYDPTDPKYWIVINELVRKQTELLNNLCAYYSSQIPNA